MAEKPVLSTEHAEHVRHLIGNPIFAIETVLPSLTRSIEKGETAEANRIITAIQRCIETAKQRLHDLDVAPDTEVKFEEFKPDEEGGIGLMPMAEFINSVKANAITDDDGTGFFVTTTLDNNSRTMESNKRVVPSEIARGTPIPPWATHVAWYSK